MSEYEEQAEKFLEDTRTEFKAEFLKHGKHFEGDEEEERDIYLISLKRGGREYKFEFGQSIAESGFKLMNPNTGEVKYLWFDKLTYNQDRNEKKLRMDIVNKIGNLGCFYIKFGSKPTAYGVLACLTTSDPETFADFCDNFGYDTDSIKADKVYRGVVEEWNNVKMLFSDSEIEELGEIN